VSYPRLPQPILTLNSRNAFFKYATRFAAKDDNRSVEGAGVQPKEIRTARPKNVRLVDERFRVNDEVLEDFFGFLDAEQIPVLAGKSSSRHANRSLRIEVEIYNALWGAEAAQKNRGDLRSSRFGRRSMRFPMPPSFLTDPAYAEARRRRRPVRGSVEAAPAVRCGN
jgi:hypothetical protein